MDQTKSPLASTGVWGGVIAVAASALAFFGFGISPEDATAAAGHAQTLYDSALAVAAAIGGVIAIWGRIRATKKIG